MFRWIEIWFDSIAVILRIWRKSLGLEAEAEADTARHMSASAEWIAELRPAGPESMRNPPLSWDKVDEAADEFFTASDPPGFYEVALDTGRSQAGRPPVRSLPLPRISRYGRRAIGMKEGHRFARPTHELIATTGGH